MSDVLNLRVGTLEYRVKVLEDAARSTLLEPDVKVDAYATLSPAETLDLQRDHIKHLLRDNEDLRKKIENLKADVDRRAKANIRLDRERGDAVRQLRRLDGYNPARLELAENNLEACRELAAKLQKQIADLTEARDYLSSENLRLREYRKVATVDLNLDSPAALLRYVRELEDEVFDLKEREDRKLEEGW